METVCLALNTTVIFEILEFWKREQWLELKGPHWVWGSASKDSRGLG